MSGDDLAAPLGPLPPLKIHCAQLVEGALRSALAPDEKRTESEKLAPTLIQQFQSPKQESKRIILGNSNERRS